MLGAGNANVKSVVRFVWELVELGVGWEWGVKVQWEFGARNLKTELGA